MTTWSLEQVRQVRSAWAEGVIDPTYSHFDESVAALRAKLARRIVDTCHPFGVEVHPGDIAFDETAEGARFKINARWRPSTKRVELIGGHEDGRTYEFQGAPNEILKVAVMPSLSMPDLVTEIEPTELKPMSLVFSLSGWRESERHWVYAARE